MGLDVNNRPFAIFFAKLRVIYIYMKFDEPGKTAIKSFFHYEYSFLFLHCSFEFATKVTFTRLLGNSKSEGLSLVTCVSSGE